MTKQVKGIITIAVLAGFFGLGVLLASLYNNFAVTNDIQQKPVIDIKEKREIITEDSQIIYEQEYLKCNHVVISQFKDREILEGKTLEQLKKIFTTSNGYNLILENETLIIRQAIKDWCPEEKNKCRLKEYQGLLAVYKGPDADNDVLEKVTSIDMNSLPADLQEKIRQGKWEFKNMDMVNDALENLDEYM